MFLYDPERTTRLTKGRRAFEVYRTKRNGPGSNVGGNCGDNMLGDNPLKFSSQFAVIVYMQTRLGGKVLKALTDVFDLALGRSESSARRPVVLSTETDKAIDYILELESERVELKPEVGSLTGKVKRLRIYKESVSAEVVAVGSHCDKLNDESISRRTELERSCVTLAARIDFVEQLKEHNAAKKSLFLRKQKASEERSAENKQHLDAVLTETMANRYRLRY